MQLHYLLIVALVGMTFAAPPGAEITDLPGLDGGVSSLNFTMYSGYVTINEQHNTSLFYWFVESQRDPSSVRAQSIKHQALSTKHYVDG